jgi:hypothetical protein
MENNLVTSKEKGGQNVLYEKGDDKTSFDSIKNCPQTLLFPAGNNASMVVSVYPKTLIFFSFS